MKKRFHTFFLNINLKQKLILCILFCILLQNLLFLILGNRLLYRQKTESAKRHLQNECFLICNQLENQYRNTVLCSNELISTINKTLGNASSKNAVLNQLESAFRYNLHLFPFLDSILFYPENGYPVYVGTEISPDHTALCSDLLSTVPASGVPRNTFLEIDWRKETGICSEPVMTFCKRVIHIDTGTTLGYLIINIKESKISGLFTNAGQHYYLVNEKGRIVSSTHKEDLFTTVNPSLAAALTDVCREKQAANLTARALLYTWIGLESFPYVLVNQTPLSDITGNVRYNTLLILTVCAATIASVIFLTSFFSRLITTPLEYLSQKMGMVKKGDFHTRSYLQRRDELGDISNSFNEMVMEIEKLTEQTKTDQEQKHRYELSLIQSQINPHFFYNVLDLIYVMCYQSDAREAAFVTKYLADYYRHSLNNGKECIPLTEEFEIIRNYLAIQQYRYQDLLDYEMNLQPCTENFLVPKMTLQPLVENALCHGLKESCRSGKIVITAHLRRSFLFLAVSDNGIGMQKDFLRQLMLSQERQNHFGLKSVILRLRLYYRDCCRIRIFSKKNQGTTVLIRIAPDALCQIQED